MRIRATLALVLLVGCWRGSSPDPAPPQNIAPVSAKPVPRRPMTEIEAAVAPMRGFTAQMCACKDQLCADEVQDELTSWSRSMARNPAPAELPSGALMMELQKEMQDIGMRYAECMMKAIDPAANP